MSEEKKCEQEEVNLCKDCRFMLVDVNGKYVYPEKQPSLRQLEYAKCSRDYDVLKEERDLASGKLRRKSVDDKLSYCSSVRDFDCERGEWWEKRKWNLKASPVLGNSNVVSFCVSLLSIVFSLIAIGVSLYVRNTS